MPGIVNFVQLGMKSNECKFKLSFSTCNIDKVFSSNLNLRDSKLDACYIFSNNLLLILPVNGRQALFIIDSRFSRKEEL